MKKNVLLFFVLFCPLLSTKSFSGGVCKYCGYEYEEEYCPFEEQHRLLLSQLEAFLDSPNEEGASGAYTETYGGGSVLAGFETGVLTLMNPISIQTDIRTNKPLGFENEVMPVVRFDGHELKRRCKEFQDKAGKQRPGSKAWQHYWQQAHRFAMQHSYNRHCHFSGVIALTKLQRYAEALKLLDQIRSKASRQGETAFLIVIANQEAFINSCIQLYGYH